MFQFELLDMEGKVLQTISNSADGVVQFAAINYNTIGTYEYKVREVKGSLDRVTYDLRVFDVTVNVTEAEAGKLIANVVYPINKIQFINHYEAISQNNSTYVNLEATKTLTGKDLAAGMFSFQLLDDRGNLIETVKNSLDGKIKFKTLHYYSAGTYSYKMVEVNDGLSGITYDSQAVDVTITVTENGTGQLEAAVKYPNKKPEFTNNYQSGTTSAVIEVTKKLIGKDLASGMFTFELLDSKGNVIQTVSNSSDGKVQFAAISYDRTGTYEYKVREVKGSFNEIIYDESIYDITVSVTDKGNGGLISTVSNPEGKVVFKNNIIQGSLEITKTDAVTGEPLANAEFTIRNAIGSVVALGKTDENGNVVFEGLFYGKYTYEETAVPEGYLIDNNKYPFEIVNQNEVVMIAMHNERKSAGPETPLDPEKPDNTVEQSIPKTGEPGVGKAIMIVLLGVGGLIITTRKKRIIKGKIG